MKKNLKKIIPAVAIITALSSTSVFAQTTNETKTDDSKTIEATKLVESIKATEPTEAVETTEASTTLEALQIQVENKVLEVSAINLNDKLLVPVRAIAESLGFEITWDKESKTISLINSPVQVTFTIDVDGYTFAKTAPMPIGQAPVMIDWTTYVPVNLFNEILSYNVAVNENNSIVITSPATTEEGTTTEETTNTEDKKDPSSLAEEGVPSLVSSISSENGIDTLTIETKELGTVVLNVNPETILEDAEGKKITFDQIMSGSEILVFYSPVMTLSLPPINNPIKIVLMK